VALGDKIYFSEVREISRAMATTTRVAATDEPTRKPGFRDNSGLKSRKPSVRGMLRWAKVLLGPINLGCVVQRKKKLD
jgi:hypothetical protein